MKEAVDKVYYTYVNHGDANRKKIVSNDDRAINFFNGRRVVIAVCTMQRYK